MEIKPLQETLTGANNFLLYGPSGAGKTRSISTMPEGTIMLSADSGRTTLKDIAPNLPVGVIDNIGDLSEAIGTVDKKIVKDDKFGDHQVISPRNDGLLGGFKYVVIDDLSVISKVVLNFEKTQTKDGRQAYGRMEERVDALIDVFFKLPQVFIFIAQEERVNQEDAGLFDYVLSPSIPGRKYCAKIPYLFNNVFAMRIKTNDSGEIERRFQTDLDGTGVYLAKSRTERLSLYEESNWVSIFNKLNDEA